MGKNLSFFERYLSVWVFLCIIGGILLGKAAPGIASTLNDFLSIDKASYEIVAITGNSMGWYTALALGGAISLHDGYHLIQFMGSIMEEGTIGGQIIYPIIDKEWKIDDNLKDKILFHVQEMKAYISNYLGGYIVIRG